MYSVWSHLFCCVLFLEHTHIYTHAAYMHTVLCRWCIHSEVLFCFSVFYLSCIQSEVIHFASVRFLNTHLLMQHSRTLLPYQPITDSLWHFCQGRQELVPFCVSISNCRGTFCVLKLEEMTCSTGFSSQSKALDAQSSFPIWPEDGSRGLSGCCRVTCDPCCMEQANCHGNQHSFTMWNGMIIRVIGTHGSSAH